MYKEYEKGKAPAVLERFALLYRAADAFIVVSGEYNHSIPPALSNLLDHFLEEYFFRPSAIVCYSAGAFGGVRHGTFFQLLTTPRQYARFPEVCRGFVDRPLAVAGRQELKRRSSAMSSGAPVLSSVS